MGRYLEYQKLPAVPDNEQVLSESECPLNKFPRPHRRWPYLVAGVLVALSIGVSCFFLGKHVQRVEQTNNDLFTPTGSIPTVFTYHKELTGPPSNYSKHTWRDTFPRGGGFVKHANISPDPAVFAVYHQLHCVSSIWRAYWAVVEGTKPDHDSTKGHVRHCIDYLRQSIMCLADTTLEPLSEELEGGASGFGGPRMCRDYDGLTAFAEEWRVFDF